MAIKTDMANNVPYHMPTKEYPTHSERVRAALDRVENERDAILKLAQEVLKSDAGNIFPLDFIALASVKRCLNMTTAFKIMIETWNLSCARALLRMHIDTALRLSAAWLVEDPHEFARAVTGGTPINKIKDRTGARLSDSYLVQIHSTEHPWLPDVYKHLSGYVHLSGSHMYDSVASLDDTTHTMQILLSDTDTKFPEFSWLEIIDCFSEISEMIGRYLSGYAITKDARGQQRDEDVGKPAS